jgi:hypothetical protein
MAAAARVATVAVLQLSPHVLLIIVMLLPAILVMIIVVFIIVVVPVIRALVVVGVLALFLRGGRVGHRSYEDTL